MTLNVHDTGTQEATAGGLVVFSVRGHTCTLPNAHWYAGALQSLRPPHSPLGGEEPQVLWLLEENEEAARVLGELAPGVALVGIETLNSQRPVVVVSGPSARCRALLSSARAAEALSIILESSATQAVAPSDEGEILILGGGPGEAACLAGIICSLWRLSKSKRRADVLEALLELAHTSSRT